MYTVKDEQFEGPLDLLLSLIEKEQLDITRISLANITSAYLAMVSEIEGDSADLADFLVIAAKLLYIKSHSLIPAVATAEEEAEIEDLESKLREYSKYKAAARHLEQVLSEHTRSYTRRAPNENQISFTPPGNLDGNSLFAIFQEVLAKAEEVTPSVTEIKQEPKISIEEKRVSIARSLRKSGRVSFRKILGGSMSKVEIIVTFLAILEMVKQKEVSVEQTGNFSDFEIISLLQSQKH